MFRRSRSILVAAALVAFSAPAIAQTVEVPGVGQVTIQSFIVTVVSANPATREVIVKAQNGNQYAYQVSPIVGPLDALEPNDHIDVSIIPGTVSDLEKAQSGTPGMIDQDILDTSIFSSLPENFYATSITANVILVDVNPAARTIMFEGADGQVRTLAAANDEVAADLASVQPGDLCQITYVEAMSLKLHE
jgi:hypothetical protein